jgi:hypothetical protein
MAEYRAYPIDRAGHVAAPPTVITAEDDETALAQARQMVDGKDLEIWSGARLVGRVPSSHQQ